MTTRKPKNDKTENYVSSRNGSQNEHTTKERNNKIADKSLETTKTVKLKVK